MCDKLNTYCGVLFSLRKRKEIITQATIWMNFEDIMLNEVRQSVTRGQIANDSTYIRYLEQPNS